MKISRLLLRIRLLDGERWNRAHEEEQKKRASSGYTSVRISRATRRELVGLLERVRVTHPGWRDRGPWKRRHLGLDELLYAVARADVKALEGPGVRARATTHANGDVGKSMHAHDRASACTDTSRPECMHSTDPAQLDALEAIA